MSRLLEAQSALLPNTIDQYTLVPVSQDLRNVVINTGSNQFQTEASETSLDTSSSSDVWEETQDIGTVSSTQETSKLLLPTIGFLARTQGGWAQEIVDTQQRLQAGRVDRDKGTRRIASALAKYAIERDGIIFEEENQRTRREKLYTQVYLELHALGKEYTSGNLAFMNAIFFDIVPTLLSINDTTEHPLSESGNNSIEQIVATVRRIMQAEKTRDSGGRFYIFSPMCSQMDTGPAHDETSCARGLLKTLNEEKLAASLKPIRHIAHTLKQFDIPVTIITPQVTAHPEMLMAMVPSTVWGYITTGRVAEMLVDLEEQQRNFPNSASKHLGITPEDDAIVHIAPSYTEFGSHGESLISRTLHHAKRFQQVMEAYHQAAITPLDQSIENRWTLFPIHHVRSIASQLTPQFINEISDTYGWTQDERTALQIMTHNLSLTDNFGVLKHLEQYYDREIQRRTNKSSEEWMRTFDREQEIAALLNNPSFSPLADTETDTASYVSFSREPIEEEIEIQDPLTTIRRQRAEKLLDWVNVIGNIDMGGRGIFNVALYVAIGEFAVELNQKGNSGILIPLEEDIERFSSQVMMQIWEAHMPQQFANVKKKGHTIPLIYNS